MASRSPQPRRHRQRRRRPLLTAVLGVGALVAALEVSAHAVNANDVLRPSSGIAPAEVYTKPGAAKPGPAPATTAPPRPGTRQAIGSSVVVIIGKPPKAATARPRPPRARADRARRASALTKRLHVRP